MARTVWLVVLIGGFPYLSVDIARICFRLSGCSIWVRLPLWAIAAFLMGIPIWLASVLLRRKITSGHFLLNRAESAARRAEMQKKIGAGKPFWPQASLWAVPVLFSAFFLALGVLAIAGAANFGPSAMQPFLLLLALAALCLFIPLQMIFKTVRRHLKTGSYLPSEEELVAARLRSREPQPLWLRLLMAGVMLVNAVLQTDMAMSRFHRGHGALSHSLVIACLWWGISAFWIWRLLRPKQCEIAEPPPSH